MNSRLHSLGVRLVNDAANEGITIRLIGSIGILVLMDHDGRGRPESPKDIDLVAAEIDREGIQSLLDREGWSVVRELLLVAERRETYLSNASNVTVDVFYDEVEGSYPIMIGRRLKVCFPTLCWTDLLLTKLQRHTMRKEDLWDLDLLLGSPEDLDRQRFQEMVGGSWCLYTAVRDNLDLMERVGSTRRDAIITLRQAVDDARKSLQWRLRSYLGRRIKWWREVSDAEVSA